MLQGLLSLPRPTLAGDGASISHKSLLLQLYKHRLWFLLLLVLLPYATFIWKHHDLLPSSLQQEHAALASRPQVRRLMLPVTQLEAMQAPVHAPASEKELEVWARPVADGHTALAKRVKSLLGVKGVTELESLCGRCLYRTLTRYVRMAGSPAHPFTLVMTGDIPAMWIRDSAVQCSSLLPRVQKRPALRGVVEGAIRAQAFFLLQDPWANAFNISYCRPRHLSKQDRQLGRGGWVWTRNFELDSIGYFYNLLHNYYHTDSIWAPGSLLSEPLVHDAVAATLKVLAIEQDHDARSPYRYSELSRQGLGPNNTVTGMIWSAFRPSDDAQVYSYHIPDNMYVAGALQRLIQLNDVVWRDAGITRQASRLAMDIQQGIERYGIITLPKGGGRVYAYEVDGRGNHLVDFDDPNVPSLLAMPLLGYKHYDEQVYLNTRKRILSDANDFFVQGEQLTGLASPHTPSWFVWPLATAVQALTSSNADEQARLLASLVMMSAGNGLVHESVQADDVMLYTRPEFGWANALLVTVVEQLLGIDCDAAAERARLKRIANREHTDKGVAGVGGPDQAVYYEQLEADVQFVMPEVDVQVWDVQDWDEAQPAAASSDLTTQIWGDRLRGKPLLPPGQLPTELRFDEPAE